MRPHSIFARIGDPVRMAFVLSGRGPETFKSHRKPVPIGEVLVAIWQMYGAAMESLQGFEHWAIVLREQAIR